MPTPITHLCFALLVMLTSLITSFCVQSPVKVEPQVRNSITSVGAQPDTDYQPNDSARSRCGNCMQFGHVPQFSLKCFIVIHIGCDTSIFTSLLLLSNAEQSGLDSVARTSPCVQCNIDTAFMSVCPSNAGITSKRMCIYRQSFSPSGGSSL